GFVIAERACLRGWIEGLGGKKHGTRTETETEKPPTLRRPPLPTATRMNAILHPQRAYRRTSDRTSYNQPSLDDGMAHHSATRPGKSTPNLRFLGLRLPYS